MSTAAGVTLRQGADAASISRREGAGQFALLDLGAAEAIREEWRVLSARSAEDNLFFESDFALVAMRAFGRDVAVATWRAPDGRLAALAPIKRTRLGRLAPAMRLWSHDYGPLAVPFFDREQIRPAVRGLLGGLAGDGSLVLPDVWLEGAVADSIRAFALESDRPLAIIGEKTRAVLDGSRGAVDCRALLTLRRRREFSRQMRRLAELGRVTIEASGDPAWFKEFLALEASGWKGRGGTAMQGIAPVAAMARAIVAAKARRDELRIHAIRLDGRAIAMLVCFLSGRAAYCWKIAYDESFARFSPGAQLMIEAGTRLLALPGIDRVDSCAEANHPMADHVWKDRRAIGTLVIGPAGGGALFQAGLAVMRGEIAARRTVKQLIKRRREKRDRRVGKDASASCPRG
jgi:CelD/BcsL family acetyltransferase involved in cellulose biosynthesis